MTMKENIQVNLFGTIYHMDRDAYELLKKYEDNMRQYFSRREDGDEIADDIEHRVAELIEDLRQNGTVAITIEHVEDIIRRIGRPEDFADPGKDGDGSETDSTDSQARQAFGRLRDDLYDAARSGTRAISRRKLFRDPRDKMLGGVLSGLTRYFGLKNPLWMRLLMVLLFFCSYSTIIIVYAILWILIPQAQTPEDFLRMDGKDVTPESLGEQIVNSNKEGTASAPRQGKNSGINQLLSFLSKILYIFILITGGVILLTIAIVFVSLIVAGIVLFSHSAATSGQLFGANGVFTWGDYYIPAPYIPLFWTFFGCVIVGSGLILYCGIAFFLSLKGRMAPMRLWQRITLAFLILVTIVGSVVSATIINDKLKANGIEFRKDKKELLDTWFALDWADFYEHRDGSEAVGLNQAVSFSDLQPGRYKVTIPAAADARGCVLYAMNNHGQVLAMKELPVSKYLNTTSEDRLKALHHQVLSNDSLGQLPDSIRLSGQLYGSSADDDYNYAILPEETLEFSVPQGGSVTIGITTDNAITRQSWNGYNVAFSTDPFRLEKIQ